MLLFELNDYPFLYNKQDFNYRNVKSRQCYIDAFNLIAVRIMEKDCKYFYITGKND